MVYIEVLILINIRMTSLDNRYFLIYKTTNLINGKIYIGKHITRCIDDGYVGSGKLLRRAISKYGIENFTREILFMCSSEEEMNVKEAELVTEEFCNQNTNYNLCVGGRGGFSYINREGIQGFTLSSDLAKQGRIKANQNGALQKALEKRKILQNDAEWVERNKIAIREGLAKVTIQPNFLGKKHTNETKERMRSSNKRSQKISIDGIEYNSISQASKELNTYTTIIIRRLKSNKFDNYRYI